MDTAIFLIDPSPEGVPRDADRFARLIHIILNTDIKEIYLVSRRPGQAEAPFLDKIPEKVFEKKGLMNRLLRERLRKKHIQSGHFELTTLLNKLRKESRRDIFLYFEDEPNDLAYDGNHIISKFLKMAGEKKGSIIELKKIPFSEISRFILLKGSLLSEGEYQIQSAFRAERALQSSSNLALMNRFIFKPPFFKLLEQNGNMTPDNAFIESLNLWARTEPVFGCLPFQPLKIK